MSYNNQPDWETYKPTIKKPIQTIQEEVFSTFKTLKKENKKCLKWVGELQEYVFENKQYVHEGGYVDICRISKDIWTKSSNFKTEWIPEVGTALKQKVNSLSDDLIQILIDEFNDSIKNIKQNIQWIQNIYTLMKEEIKRINNGDPCGSCEHCKCNC